MLFQHLLCLLLQSLASIALNPSHHQALNDADIADMLMQLLLPSDEWYYTNHSTKYAKYVKYHAARILVYMGLLHKLGGRIDLFDRRRMFIFIHIARFIDISLATKPSFKPVDISNDSIWSFQ